MATPTHLSPYPPDTDLSTANVGSEMLGLGLFEQGDHVTCVLNAKREDGRPLYRHVAVLIPRRGQKSTSIWANVLGRLATIPGYKVAFTAQDGTRARNAFREVARTLAARGYEDNGTLTVRWANGSEAFEFANGSRLWVVAPNAGAFRGEAADLLWFDEAGEYDPDKSAELLEGALPLLDTRPMGQAIISGTPARSRAGLLWDTLTNGRNGKARVGVVDYSISDTESAVIVDEDGNVRPNVEVIERVHPGINTLTDLETILERFETMALASFEREYLCRFPTSNAEDALNPDAWAAGELSDMARPERVGIAFDCAYDGTSASLAYAWRDEDGNAYGELVAHEPGTAWVPSTTQAALAKYKRQSVAYDNIGANMDPANVLTRARARVTPLNTPRILAAAQRLASDVNGGRFRHLPQRDLDAAVANATWRDVGKSGRAFGTKDAAGASINPLVAVSLALWQYDQERDRKRVGIVA